MRQRGLRRAQTSGLAAWREQFTNILTPLLGRRRDPSVASVEVTPQVKRKLVAVHGGTLLIPVRITNTGNLPAPASGPAQVAVCYQLYDATGKPLGTQVAAGVLPALLPPRRSLIAAVPVTVPATPGLYQVVFMGRSPVQQGAPQPCPNSAGGESPPPNVLELVVAVDAPAREPSIGEPFVTDAQRILAEAHAMKALPLDYADVTQGFMARWKRLLKQKLLNNFRRAYVDVLSRQQSAFNERILTAVAQVTDCCAALDHGLVQTRAPREAAQLTARLRKARRRERRLLQRVAALEKRLIHMERAVEETQREAAQPAQHYP
jgi:hypothetical protein